MSVAQLSSQNFHIAGRNRKTLNINIPEPMLVFFKMDGCQGCAAFEPVFHQLSREERRVRYGAINITNARDVVQMSRMTSTSIQAVPFILLYVNGNPFAKYNGKKNLPALKSFITKALQQAPSQPAPQQGGFMQQSQGGGNERGMYGSGSYQHPQIAPQQGQAGFNHPGGGNGQRVWQPQMDKAPALQGIVKGDGTSQYAYLNDLDEEDEEKLLLPNQVTPHNVPWESNYHKLGNIDQ